MLPNTSYVLIIDDDDDLCRLLIAMLQTKKLIAVCAHSLREAHEIMKERQPLLSYLDNYLPDGTGLEFIRQLRSTHNKIKVAMITGEFSSELKERSIIEGCSYFLEKPFSYRRVNEIVDEMLSGKMQY